MDQNNTNIDKLRKFIPIFFSSEAILFMASMISFPILTRLLSKTQYGTMTLITVSVMIIENICSGGMRQSVLRFYGKYKQEEKVKEYFSSILNSSIIFTFVGIGLISISTFVLYKFNVFEHDIACLFVFSLLLVVFRIGWMTQQVFLRIQEKMVLVSLIEIATKYGNVFLGILLFIFIRNLYGFYAGMMIAEGMMAIILFIFIGRKFYNFYVEKPIIIENLQYGIPLLLSGLAIYMVGAGDRYIIAFLKDSSAVADYVVAISYAGYGVALIKSVCIYSFQPLIMNEWNKKDTTDKGVALLRQYVRLYAAIGFPAAFGLIALRKEGIELLAGIKYTHVDYLVPILVFGILINGMDFVTNSGFFYKKKTKSITFLTMGLATLNLILNLILIPIFGLMGAAIASITSYLVYAAIGIVFTKKILGFIMPWLNICRYLIFSMIMYAVISLIPIDLYGNLILIITVKVFVGGICYILLLCLFERKVISKTLGIGKHKVISK